MREFTTALREAESVDEEVEKGLPFKIDDVECVAYPPSDGQMAVLMASVNRSQSTANQIAGIINFFVEVVDEDSHAYIVGRLLDRSDPFGLEEVQSIMEWMVEEWTGHPTQPPSVSTPSQRSGGRKSKRPTTRSTSSPAARASS